nr:MAG TPA: hypothetical protein [Caudoviricetes sp.]
MVCGLTLEREEFLPQGTNCQKSKTETFSRSSERATSQRERRARNPVSLKQR